MGRLLRFEFFMACFFSAGTAYAQGGACPTAANYTSPSNGSLVTLSSLGVKSCFYISKSTGKDSNAGSSESAPQAHLPGMPSYTGKITPAAGVGFILKGGDTWTASDLGDVWTWAGSSGAPIYIGVDQGWFASGTCGTSFCRPIWSCGGAACGGTGNYANYLFVAASYVTLDNIEFTGLFTNGAGANPSYVSTQLDHDIVENSYFHGWVIQAGSTQDFGIIASFNHNNFSPYTSLGSGLFYSVIDGSDTAENSMEAVGGNPTYVVGNVIQYVSNALENIGATFVHDNYFGPVVLSFQAAAHQNVLALGQADNGQTNQFVYNNVITGTVCSVCGGVVKLWLDQYNSPTSNVGYAFNNVIYNNSNGNLINQGHGTAGQTYWTWYFFNNTVECGTDSANGACYSDAAAAGGTATFHSENNHWITSSATPVSCTTYTCTSTTDLVQTVAAAKAQGYNSSQVFAFSPSLTAKATIGAGTNYQSICNTITGLDSNAGAACTNDTGYACSYNTGNHSVSCPNETTVPRLTAWDIGAYQYSPGPPPPINIQGSVKSN